MRQRNKPPHQEIIFPSLMRLESPPPPTKLLRRAQGAVKLCFHKDLWWEALAPCPPATSPQPLVGWDQACSSPTSNLQDSIPKVPASTGIREDQAL